MTESDLRQSGRLVKAMESLVGTSHVVYQATDADGELLPIVVAEACPEDETSERIDQIELCRCSTMGMAALIAGLINDTPALYTYLEEQMALVQRAQQQVIALSEAIEDALLDLQSHGEMAVARADEVLTAGIYESARIMIGDDSELDDCD